MADWYESWNDLLLNEAKRNGESLDSIIECTLSEEEMADKFDTGYGGPEGKPFTAWSDKWVYFPVCYDGAEWVGSAPRNPCDKPTDHIGGY